ncbi:MAG TPA: hypothetical protein VGC79_32840, partial [Polyangiaceae bacterium]
MENSSSSFHSYGQARFFSEPQAGDRTALDPVDQLLGAGAVGAQRADLALLWQGFVAGTLRATGSF